MTEPTGDTPASAQARRRIDAPEPPPPGRRGCLWLGAILGVVVGTIFALFAMGPILNYFYGEANVLYGEAYDIRGLRIEVIDVREVESAGDTLLHVTLDIELSPDRDEAFPLRDNHWTIEFEGNRKAGLRGYFPEATPQSVEPGGAVTAALVFPTGEHPLYLYMGDPETRFSLDPDDVE